MLEAESVIVALGSELRGTVSLYLFGSVAEGREHAESDVDVGVLLERTAYPTERDRFDYRLLLGARISDALQRITDVVILNDAHPQLARAVVTRGKRLYCTDTEVDHAFVRNAQLQAADIEPFLRRMRSIKLTPGQQR